MRTGLIMISFIPLTVMILSDYKRRTINIVWLMVFGILQIAGAWMMIGESQTLINIITNTAILLFLYTCIGIYVTLNRKRIGSFSNTIGVGDLLFLPLITGLFEVREFLIFLIISFLIGLLYGLTPNCRNGVPLVSVVGGCLIVYMLIKITRSVCL